MGELVIAVVAKNNSAGTKNGTGDRVRLESVNNRLRLRWSASGKRHSFSLGTADTKTNRLAAQKIILQIEADLESGIFVSADQYKIAQISVPVRPQLTVVQIFDKWLTYKATHVSKRTVDWYKDTQKNLAAFFGERSETEIDKNAAMGFFLWLKDQPLKPETQQRRLESVAAAWKWAEEEKLVASNPWIKIPQLVDVPDIEDAEPFTKEECAKICKTINKLRPCSDLVPLVRFMLGCGTRPGETIGLRWADVTDNFCKVTIRSQFTKGERKAPKKNKIRKFRVSAEMQGMLQQQFLNAKSTAPEMLIFTNNGKPIDLDHFREDVWKPALKKAEVAYRPPKNCRHTFVSTMLEAGVNPVLVAKITGHDTAVMFKNYAGLLSEPVIPNF